MFSVGERDFQVLSLLLCLSSGELLTLAVLDREAEPQYNLVAKATDGGGRSCQSDILLLIQDMNDNPPRFSSPHYEVTVFDNTTVHTPIAIIYAKDPDTGKTPDQERADPGSVSAR